MKSDKVRIGVIGVGHRGEIAQYWQADPRSVLVAGADLHAPYLQAYRQQYNTVTFVTHDYHEMLSRPDIDAVAVCTPDNRHKEHAVAVLNAGKDCFLEKPMAINIEDCDAILTAWRKSGRKLMIGHNARYEDPYRTAKYVLDKGMIGKPRTLWMRHFVGHGGWAFFHDYRANRKGSCSLLLQKGCHFIDLIHWYMGGYAKKVVAMGSLDMYGGDKPNDLTCDKCPDATTCPEYSDRDIPGKRMCLYRKEVDVEDQNMVLMELDNGTHAAFLECYYDAPGTHENYYVIGEEASMEINRENVTIYTRKGREPFTRINTYDPFVSAAFAVGAYGEGHGGADALCCRAFMDLVCGKEQAKLTSGDPVAGRMAVAVGCMAAHSMRNGSMPQNIPAAP
jgi:predicted dehydrogenase